MKLSQYFNGVDNLIIKLQKQVQEANSQIKQDKVYFRLPNIINKSTYSSRLHYEKQNQTQPFEYKSKNKRLSTHNQSHNITQAYDGKRVLHTSINQDKSNECQVYVWNMTRKQFKCFKNHKQFNYEILNTLQTLND